MPMVRDILYSSIRIIHRIRLLVMYSISICIHAIGNIRHLWIISICIAKPTNNTNLTMSYTIDRTATPENNA